MSYAVKISCHQRSFVAKQHIKLCHRSVFASYLFIHMYHHYQVVILQAQDVNFAMEASRKSRIAFVAANVSLGETQHREGLSSIKKALDFYFQDIEGLLRLVRLAIEAISR